MQSRGRVMAFHRPQTLSTDNSFYRDVNQQLIDRLNSLQINALWNDLHLSIEQSIINIFNENERI